MTWHRRPVAAALVDMIGAATAGTVAVHPQFRETVNPPCVAIGDVLPGARYADAGFGVDTVELGVYVVGGFGTDDDVDDLRDVVRTAVLGDSTLKGTVPVAWPSGENGWRNATGAGGIQLLYVELVLTIQM